MKLSAGFTRLVPSMLLFVFHAVPFIALTLTLRKIEISVAYAARSGVGRAGREDAHVKAPARGCRDTGHRRSARRTSSGKTAFDGV